MYYNLPGSFIHGMFQHGENSKGPRWNAVKSLFPLSSPATQVSPPEVVSFWFLRVLSSSLCTHAMMVIVKVLVVQSFATPWTVACRAPLSMDFSRQEYWSGLPFPTPRNIPNEGIKPRSSELQVDSLWSESPGIVTLLIPLIESLFYVSLYSEYFTCITSFDLCSSPMKYVLLSSPFQRCKQLSP